MGGGGVAVGADLDEGSEAAGEQPATTSTKIVTSSQRAFCTFIRASLPDADRSELPTRGPAPQKHSTYYSKLAREYRRLLTDDQTNLKCHRRPDV